MRSMRQLRWAVAILIAGCANAAGRAQDNPSASGIGAGNVRNNVPGASQADVHNPFSPNYNPMRPGQYQGGVSVPVAPVVPYGGYGNFGGYYPYVGGPGYGTIGGWTYNGGGYLYGNGVGNNYGYNYGYYGPYGRGYGSNTVVVVPPAQPNFAPQAPAQNNIPRRRDLDDEVDRAIRSQPREVDRGDTREIARKYIKLGDGYFADQKYRDALNRYDRAIRTSPRLAEAYFRKGHVKVATGQYDAAADAFRRGVAAEPAIARTPDFVEKLYGGNRLARQAHLTALERAALESPDDGDVQFVLGVELFCEGLVHRAHEAFRKAAELTGDAPHVGAFVDSTAELLAEGREARPGRRGVAPRQAPQGEVEL